MGYLNHRLQENAVFVFISVRYTVTDLQTPKWSNENKLFSGPKKAKKNISWNIKIKYVTDVFLSVESWSMKDYTCH